MQLIYTRMGQETWDFLLFNEDSILTVNDVKIYYAERSILMPFIEGILGLNDTMNDILNDILNYWLTNGMT